jgi:hypothetical protein
MDGNLHFPVPSMNRLNQTEPATFSILYCWTFFRDSVFLYFICLKRPNEWSEFAKIDDVIPLFTKNITVSQKISGFKSLKACNLNINILQIVIFMQVLGNRIVECISRGIL